MAFSPKGEYLFCGNTFEVQVWRVEDGKRVATMSTTGVLSLAVSEDGKWLAAGTFNGVYVWDTSTHEQVLKVDNGSVFDVDFSPDASRLVCVVPLNSVASIWDLGTHKRVQTLPHKHGVFAAKYSPEGDRIATTAHGSARVYDSSNGNLLVDINVEVDSCLNGGSLLWFNGHLLVVSDRNIARIEIPTGTVVSKWLAPNLNPSGHIHIAQPSHGEFIICSADKTVSFWDTATYTRIGLSEQNESITSIAVSPDTGFLAIGCDSGVTFTSLSHITVRTVSIQFVLVRNFIDIPC